MIIVHHRPPNWKEIQERFQVDPTKVVVTYGDVVHMPPGCEMYPDLRVHEGVHVGQQTRMGAQKWWDRFYVDPSFRLEQELEAYRVQYKFKQTEERNREKLAKFLVFIAQQMSGPIYGNMVRLGDAMKLIRGAAEIELVTTKCVCGEDVVTKWLGGMITCPDYTLVGDCVFHSACWDKQVAESPP